jgi:4'-phosphopantetheinyl transferase
VSLDEVYIWSLLTEAVETSDWAILEDVLDDAELRRAARFRFGGDRRAFVAARGLARHMVAHFGGRDARDWRFEREADGKPRIVHLPADVQLGFSLSHTAHMVAAAVTQAGEVGIDVEAVDRVPPDVLALADCYFAPDEAAGLRALADDRSVRERFIRLWTLKETVVKATGRGLSQPLNGFSFLSFEPVRVVFHTTELGDPAHWAFWQQAMGSHVVAVAVRQASSKPLRFIHRAIMPSMLAPTGSISRRQTGCCAGVRSR